MRFAPYFLMLSMLAITRFLQRRQNRRRAEQEASRLAALLAVELRSLLEHYRDIFALLAGGGGVLLPLRGAGLLYRNNAGRLAALLDEGTVGPVVACYAHHERIDAVLQTCVRPNSGCVLRPDIEAGLVDRLCKRLMAGCQLAEAAIAALAPAPASDQGGFAAPFVLWFGGQREAWRRWGLSPGVPAGVAAFLAQPRPR